MLVCNIWNWFLRSNKDKIWFIPIQANSLLRELLVKQTWDTPDSFGKTWLQLFFNPLLFYSQFSLGFSSELPPQMYLNLSVFFPLSLESFAL